MGALQRAPYPSETQPITVHRHSRAGGRAGQGRGTLSRKEREPATPLCCELSEWTESVVSLVFA